MTDTPEPGWLPDPDGGGFNRWWDGKHFTKRVQGEPPKLSAKETVAGPLEAPDPIPYPTGSARRRPPAVPKTTTVVVKEPLPEPEEEQEEIPDATAAAVWPLPSTIAAVVSGLGLVGAFLLPLGRLPLVIAALGLAGSVVALVLAITNDERRFVAIWGIGIGAVGVIVGATISMLG